MGTRKQEQGLEQSRASVNVAAVLVPIYGLRPRQGFLPQISHSDRQVITVPRQLESVSLPIQA